MATKKTTINELRYIVKQIIKEEIILREALNKDIRQFAQDLGKYLTKDGFQVKYVSDRIPDEDYAKLRAEKGLIAFVYNENASQQSMYMYFNPIEKPKVAKIVDKFQLSPYSGKPMHIGWDIKQVQGAINPGDIYKAEDKGMYLFFRPKKVNTKVTTEPII